MHGLLIFVSFRVRDKSRYDHVSIRKRIAVKWLITVKKTLVEIVSFAMVLTFFSCPGHRRYGS